MPGEVTIVFESDVLYFHGLRGNQYLSIDIADLFEAMARSVRGARGTFRTNG